MTNPVVHALRPLIAGALLWALAAPGQTQERHPLDAAGGKALFERQWVTAPASTAASDGLGPFYNARSCATCHPGAGRGRTLQAVVLRSDDPVYGRQLQPLATAGLQPELALQLAYVPVTLAFDDGSSVVLEELQVDIEAMRFGRLQSGWSARLAPSLHGLALLAAVDTAALEALADPDDRDGDGISGRLARVTGSDGMTAVGRFGWKAETASLAQQSASAFSLDLGLGTPIYPASHGDCRPAQADCLQQVPGTATGTEPTEIGADLFELVLAYLDALPPLSARTSGNLPGRELFTTLGCAACHVPSLPGAQGPVPAWTDLLLHDLGQDLADTLGAESASPAEWRTPPLWGVGSAWRLLHDGRAADVEAAILWHGGEAAGARAAYRSLPAAQRRQLLDFVEGL